MMPGRSACLAPLAALLLAAARLLPGQTTFNSAGVDARWLGVPGSARVAALAGAFAARGGDPGGLDANPASLAGLQGAQGYFTHNAWMDGISLERLAAALPLGRWGAGALQVDYFNFGILERYGLDASGQALPQGSASLYGWGLGGSWARDFGDLALGGTLRWSRQQLVTAGSAHLDADLGARYALGGWRTGLSLRNLSADLGSAVRPMSWQGGLGYTFAWDLPLALDANMDFKPNDAAGPGWRLAGEWTGPGKLALRGGWLLADGRLAPGPSLGLGWSAEFLALDYAYCASGDLSASHLLTLRFTGWGI